MEHNRLQITKTKLELQLLERALKVGGRVWRILMTVAEYESILSLNIQE